MMTPVSPVMPQSTLPEFTLAKDQPEYTPLPAVQIRNDLGTIVTRWRLSEVDRYRIAHGADITLQQLTFGGNFQPVNLQVTEQHLDPEIVGLE
jgi:hypothetical protein